MLFRSELFEQYAKLYQEGQAAYSAQYGPLLQSDSVSDGRYHWLNDPWPWEYEGGAE